MDRLPADLMQSTILAQVPVRTHHAAPSSNVVLAAWHHPKMMCLLAAAALGAGALALTVMPKKYVAEAVLQLNLDRREDAAVDARGSAIVLDAGAMVQGELKVIRSRAVARRVVERLGLGGSPTTAPAESPHPLLAMALEAWHTLRDALPAGLRPAPAPQGTAQPVAAAEDGVMGRMTAESDNRSYLVTIRYTADSPDQAAAVANALAEEYIARRQDANVEAARKTVDWLDEQLRRTTGQMEQAQASADDYREQTGLLELGNSETVGQQRLRDLAARRSAGMLARSEAQARLGRLQDAARVGGIPSVDDVGGSPQIRSILERRAEARVRLNAVQAELGPGHPQVVQAQAVLSAADAALGVELRSALLNQQTAVATATRVEQEAAEGLDAAQKSVIDSKRNENDLRSRQTITQNLHDRLANLTRARDQALAVEQLRPVAATLIVPAEPPGAPVSPKPVVVLPLTLAGGVGLGALLASLLERRDRGFWTGTDVEPMLGKRCLGMVPEAPLALGLREPPATVGLPERPRALTRARARPVLRAPRAVRRRWASRSAFEASLLAETVRSVGAALGLFDVSGNCRVVLVTSSLSGEGKSTFCRALADVLVASGRRVLLVDGSPPRGSRGGAPDPMADDSPARLRLTVLRRSESGSVASDVFGTAEFTQVLERTRMHFDIIILEGPAVMLVADSLVLGRLSDSVIHVTRWAKTRRATVAAALNRLHESAIAVDGVVLTRVDLARHAALKTTDLGSHYLKERRFYEQLLRPTPPRAAPREPQPSREA